LTGSFFEGVGHGESTRTRDAGNPDACNACLEGDDDDEPRVTAAVPREALVTIQETQED
jgi:hypothetical protein